MIFLEVTDNVVGIGYRYTAKSHFQHLPDLDIQWSIGIVDRLILAAGTT
jgi:hypothetical protein